MAGAHGFALDIDLRRNFGVSLCDILAERVPLWWAAEAIDRLPRGCLTFQEVGGWQALTVADQLALETAHGLQVLAWQQSKDGQNNRNPPKAPAPPKGKYQAEHEERERSERLAVKAERHAARMARRAARTPSV